MLRLAFVGKGGAGKSTIAGTFARLLAQRGEPVLVIDSDPMPGLSLSLGAGTVEAPLPDEAVFEEKDGERTVYRLRLDAADAVEAYAATAPGGVRLLQFGKLRGHVGALMRSQSAFQQIIDGLPANGWHIIGDLPGGTRQPFFGWARYASTVVIVVEPNSKSILSARRLAGLAASKTAPERIVAVVNKARDEDDVERVRQRLDLDVVASVPYDEGFGGAERAGVAPVDVAPEGPGVLGVQSLVQAVETEAQV